MACAWGPRGLSRLMAPTADRKTSRSMFRAVLTRRLDFESAEPPYLWADARDLSLIS